MAMNVKWHTEGGRELEIPPYMDGASLAKGDTVVFQPTKRYASRIAYTVVSREWRLVGDEPYLSIFMSEKPGNYYP